MCSGVERPENGIKFKFQKFAGLRIVRARLQSALDVTS